MTTVAFCLEAFEQLQSLARSESLETCAVGLVSRAGSRASRPRFVVRDLAPAPDSAYLAREQHRATLTPQFCMELANRARAQGAGVLLAHTHPGIKAQAIFSAVDDDGEKPLRDYFSRRVPGQTHFAAVITTDGGRCRSMGSQDAATLSLVGQVRRTLSAQTGAPDKALLQYDRQIRAFGADGQAILGRTRVGIVGLGGTGSFIAHELAYLGIRDFLLIDPDKVDETNLNRLLGASSKDIGRQKTLVAKQFIKRISRGSICKSIVGDIVDDSTARRLLDTDFIFLCTDSHASRAVVNQLSHQYLIPCIDMGVAVHTLDGNVKHIAGRVQALSAGLPCLVCANWIDPNQVRQEMMSKEQRCNDPYFVGQGIPQPAVISLNGTIASAAVSMFLAMLTSFPGDARMLLYDAVRGAMRPTVMTPQADCIVCSSAGALARGDHWPLPTRHAPALD